MDSVQLAVFASRVAAVCDEMGAVLRRTAFSPNIRDRLDFSCAVFDAAGGLVAQAAHIPVHLGSMAYAMEGVVSGFQWQPGDVVVFNDPFLGGTHLPDVTLVAPVFSGERLIGFAANRAHHADIGAASPGSMPLSRSLHDEGVVIPPARLYAAGAHEAAEQERITAATRNPRRAAADLAAQVSAVRAGAARLAELAGRLGAEAYAEAVAALNGYAERLVRSALAEIPDGRYTFADALDDDGQGRRDLPIRVAVTVAGDAVGVDFRGSAGQVDGNVNCPLPVTAAGIRPGRASASAPQTASTTRLLVSTL
ncbi:hydantoinase B/oxoprolinase family protein, partial [Halorhodospira neutriphila]